MITTELEYGKDKLSFSVSEDRILGVLKPNSVEIGLTGEAEVERALDAPIGADKIENVVRPGQKICIITSDISRPMPSWVALPPLLRRLEKAGIPKKDILIVFALGSHRGHTEEEKIHLVGEKVYREYACVDSSEEQVAYLGTTTRGTEVSVFSPVVEADFRICMGNIEFHYFAGYSGGAKAIMPGVSTKEAIRQNHRMMVMPEAHAGNIESPVRKDIEEVDAKFVRADYILNVVLDEHKNIIKCVAGDSILAHRAGCAFLDTMYKIAIPKRADIVIAGMGGYPKDQWMYQAQKALENAKHAVKKGGVIIWVAKCDDGIGSKIFEEWMTTIDPAEMPERLKKNFLLGAHKATAVSLVLANCEIYLISALDRDLVTKMHFTPFDSIQAALDKATAKCGPDSEVYIMPYAGSTLPRSADSGSNSAEKTKV